MERIILDSNTAIYLLNGTLNSRNSKIIASAGSEPVTLSVVSRIELLGWNAPTQNEMTKVANFVNKAVILPLNEAIIQQTIVLRRKHKIKLPDAIIAATALVHELTLVTRNISDFDSIDGLNVVNPFD